MERIFAEPVFGKSGLISTLVQADGLLKIDRNTEGFYKGQIVDVMLFRPFRWGIDMKRNVYLAMKTLEDARSIFFQGVEGKETLPEEIKSKTPWGVWPLNPCLREFLRQPITVRQWNGIAVRAQETYGTTEKAPKY